MDWKFIIKTGLLIAILVTLVGVYFTAGGDPCNRCKFESEWETVTCREAIKYYVDLNYRSSVNTMKNYTSPYDLNISFG